jgi:hypothetical protein
MRTLLIVSLPSDVKGIKMPTYREKLIQQSRLLRMACEQNGRI